MIYTIIAYTITVILLCLILGTLAVWEPVRAYISRLDDIIKERMR